MRSLWTATTSSRRRWAIWKTPGRSCKRVGICCFMILSRSSPPSASRTVAGWCAPFADSHGITAKKSQKASAWNSPGSAWCGRDSNTAEELRTPLPFRRGRARTRLASFFALSLRSAVSRAVFEFARRSSACYAGGHGPDALREQSARKRCWLRKFSLAFRPRQVNSHPSLTTMKFNVALALSLLVCLCSHAARPDKPLRVFIRAGAKTHGPNQHDHPRFLAEWKEMLNQRGAKADGSMDFPTGEQLENTDVLVIYAQDGMKVVGEQRASFEKFLRRGGGLVVIHDGVVSSDQHEWAKKVQGGSWRWDGDKKTKWLEGEAGIYFVDQKHPIVRGVSNFDWKDEIYYDLDMAPDVHVLATSFHSVYVIAPQMWTYEKNWEGGSAPYRAFVSIPGHEYASFQTPHYRAILLRGIAWAGKRDSVDFLCSKEELNSLSYPAGGPTAPEKAAAKLNVHPEFNLSLVASEPLIEKVISLDWDPKGRLWVAETPEYPNGRAINRNDAPIYPDRALHPDRYSGDKEDRPAHDRT